MVNLLSSFMIFITLFFSSYLYAEERYDIQKLMLTSAQRLAINKQRQQFYFIPVDRTQRVTINKNLAKKKSLPNKLSVSSVIVSPSGKKIVRVNGKYSDRAPRNSKLIPSQTSMHVTKFVVDGKRVNLPIGKTYLVQKNKIVSNYLYSGKVQQQNLRQAEKKQKKTKLKEQVEQSDTKKSSK